ncbi:MAG: VanZ family protein [Micropepsaceae bacterium]
MRYLLWLLFAVAAGIVVYFTLQPGPSGTVFTWWDKLQHFGAYGTLSLLAGLTTRAWRRALLYAALLALAGYGLEILQIYVGRSYDLADALANTLGALGGFLASRALLFLTRR